MTDDVRQRALQLVLGGQQPAATPAITPAPAGSTALSQALGMTQRADEEERRRAAQRAAAEATAAGVGLPDLRNAERAGEPVPRAPEQRRQLEAQVAVTQTLRALEQAPITMRWASDLENAAFVRADPDRLAYIERLFANPGWGATLGSIPGAVGQGVLETFGGGARGAALSGELRERQDLGGDNRLGHILTQLPALAQLPEDRRAQVARSFAQSIRNAAAVTAVGGSSDARSAAYEAMIALADAVEAGDTEGIAAAQARLGEVQGLVRPAPETPLYELGEYVSDLLPEFLRPAVGTEEFLTTQFAGAMGSLSGFMIASVATGSVGTFPLAAALGVDEQYNRAIAAGVPHEQAVRYAIDGAPAGAIQALSIEFALRRIPMPVRRRLTRVWQELGYVALAEATVESAGAVWQNVLEQRYNPERGTWDDTVAQGALSGSAAATLRGLILSMSPGARRGLFHDIERAETSAQFEQTMDALRRGLEGDQLRDAVPERFRSWAQAVTTGTEAETVFVSPQGLLELAQSANDPAILDQIIEALPGVDRAAFDAALEQQSDLAIPMATWMTDVIGTRFDTLLADHLRLDSSAPTTFERVQNARAIQTEIEALKQRVREVEDGQAPGSVMAFLRDRAEALGLSQEEVEARVRVAEEARAAFIRMGGITESAAENYAVLYTFFARTAQRLRGVTPEQFMRDYLRPLVGRDGEVPVDTGAPLDEADPLTDTLEALREAAVEGEAAEIAEARATLERLGIDPATASDAEIASALAAGLPPEQATAHVAPGSARMGRTLRATTALTSPTLRGAFAGTGVIDGVGPSALSLPQTTPWGDSDAPATLAQAVQDPRGDVLPGLERASPGPVAGVRELATKYMLRRGLPVRHQAEYARVDVERATRIAQAYEEAEHRPFDTDVRAAYEALVEETIAQYQALLELGFTFEFITGADPYATPADAIRDMQQNKHLWVFPTEEGYGQAGITDQDRAENPMLAETEFVVDGRKALVNDLFRIVHDVFGHGSEGASFGPRGEENAWQAHVRMFSPLAARAMTTETRGQNSWVNYGPHGEANRRDPKNTVYAEQKITLLPEWVSKVGQAPDAVMQRIDVPVTPRDLGQLNEDFFRRPGWFVVTGTRDTPDSERSVAANEHLRKVLRGEAEHWATSARRGRPFDFVEITGSYLGEDQGPSFLVLGTEQEGVLLGRGFSQESILTRNGFVYSDGRRTTPTTGEVFVGDDARAQDNFSETPDGFAFSLGLDFSEPTLNSLAFYPEGTVASETRPQLPILPDGTVELHHWTTGQLDVIDPAKAGTGPLRGVERGRGGPPKSFFGINPADMVGGRGTGYRKENGLGFTRHVVRVEADRLYPWFEDPDNIRAKVDAWREEYERPRPGSGRSRSNPVMEMGVYEQFIKDAGYLGYYVTEDGSRRAPNGNVAVLFGPAKPVSAVNELRGQVLFQSAASGQWYYSALTAAVRGAKQERANARDWKAIISKLPGVTKREINWTGVNDWLDTRDGMVDRAQVVRYLEAQELEIVESTGREGFADADDVLEFQDRTVIDRDDFSDEIELYRDQIDKDEVAADHARLIYRRMIREEVVEQGLLDGLAEDVDEAREAYELLAARYVDTGVIDAQTPLEEWLAERYLTADDRKELDRLADKAAEEMARDDYYREPEYELTYTLNLPSGQVTITATEDRYGDTVYWGGNAYDSRDELEDAIRERYQDEIDELRMGDTFAARHRGYAERGGENYSEVLLRIPNLESIGPNETRRADEFIEDAHFEQPNVVVHARLTRRRSGRPGENRAGVLFVEEVQSDLASSWRKAGGQPEGFADAEVQRLSAERDALLAEAAVAREAFETQRDSWVLDEARAEVSARLGELPADSNLRRLIEAEAQQTIAMKRAFDAAYQQRYLGRRFDAGNAIEAALWDAYGTMFARLEMEGDPRLAELRAAHDRHRDFARRDNEIMEELREARRDDPDLPYTPFDGSAAYELMLKRLLNMAATEGMDALAWTPGYMQAQRWSGAVQNVVTEIRWQPPTRGAERPATVAELDEQSTRLVRVMRGHAALTRDQRGELLAGINEALRAGIAAARGEDVFVDVDGSYATIQPLMQQLRDEQNAEMLRWDGLVESYARQAPLTQEATQVVELSGNNGIDIFVVDADGVILRKRSGRIPEAQVVGKNLRELIGRELTDRILAATEDGFAPGNNIVFGGDGYKIAYDQQMKRFVEKWAKKYGGKLTVRDDLPDFAPRAGVLRDRVYNLSASNMRRLLRALAGEEAVESALGDARARRLAEMSNEIERAERRIRKALELRAVHETIAADEAQADDNRAYSREQIEAVDRALALHEQQLAQLRAEQATRVPTLDADDERWAFREALAPFTPPDHRDAPQAMRDEMPELFEGLGGRPVWYIDITDEMRAAAKEPQPLFQQDRGRIVLPPRGEAPLITLFEGADLSTLLHEMGHYYLHVLQDLQRRGAMDEGLAQDWQTILAWWGNNAAAVAKDASKVLPGVREDHVQLYLEQNTTGDAALDNAIAVGLQEQWARAFESYLREGKSPSQSLRRAFTAFRAWLVSIYQTALGLNVNVSPELRAVFDRLFATDQEIAAMKDAEGALALVAESAEAMGVDAAEYARLVELQRAAQEEAEERLLRDVMAPLRRQREAEYRAERAAVEAETRERVQAEPAHRLREWLGNSRWLGGEAPAGLPAEMRMDRAALVEQFGEEVLRLLPRGRFPLYNRAGEPGMLPEDVAGWFGFRSADEMIRALRALPKLEDQVAAETEAEMARRYPDPLLDGSVEEAARDALHGEKAGQLLVAELRALARGPGVTGKVTPRQVVREIARRTIAGMPVREALRSHVWQGAERRAGVEAQEALARGDRQAAFEAKRRQLLNHMLYSESRRAAELVERVERKAAQLRKKSTRENLAGEYLGAIDEVLETYEFRRVSGRALDRRGALRRYVEMMTAAGRENELAIPQDVLDQANRVNYRELPVERLQGVYDTLTNIEHTARWKNKLRQRQRQRELDEVVDEVLSSFSANVASRPRGRVPDAADRRRRGVREYLNLVLNATTILRKIDGFADFGPAYKALKAGIDSATRDLTARREQLAIRLEALYGAYSRGEQNRMAVKTYHDAIKDSLSKWDIISIALNMGNVDNLNRLTDPDSRGYTRAQVDALVATLDKRDWDFVQGMWDLINSYWGEIEARERRLTGVAPRKVEPLPVETPFGTYRGGYYPIMYDGELSAQVNVEETAELMKNTLAGRFGKAQTANGHLKERKQGSGGRPLALGIEVAHRHLGRVVHDLAMSEAVTDTWRVLQDRRLRAAFQDAGLLHDLETLELWTQDVAAGQLAAMDLPSRLFRRLKSNFTLAKLGFNFSTVLVQLTGLAQSTVAVGHRNFALAMIEYARNPVKAAETVFALSPFMQRRQTTFNKDINDILGDVTKGPLEAGYDRFMRKAVAPMAFYTMQKVQVYGVDIPTWIAAYRSGQRQGMTEEDAIAFADSVVVRSQAGGEFSDRSAFERGTVSRGTRQSDMVRIFTTLGSYMFAKFNVAYERTAVMRQRVGTHGASARSAAEVLRYAADMATLFALEGLMYAAIMGRLPGGEDDEDWTTWAAFLARETGFGVVSTLPFARDLTGPLQGFAQGGAYGGITETVTRGVVPLVDMVQEGELTSRGARAGVNLIGLTTGLPSTAVNRVIDGLWRQSEGEEVAPIEFLMGRR